MTDQPPQPQGSFFQQRPSAPPEPVFTHGGGEHMLPLIIYILYLIPIGVTHIAGLVMAYVSRDTAPEWLRSHYTFQIRTFWIGLLYAVISGLLCLVLVGFLLVPVVVIWFIVRCALGIVRLSQREPYPNPYSWTI
jgi:uncharacterized membrane protein